jgi:hypothetical protein
MWGRRLDSSGLDRNQWRVFLNLAMNIHIHKISKIPSWTEQLLISQGRATASAVSHRLLTADASGAFCSGSCEICGGQTSTEIGFSPNKTLVVGIKAAKSWNQCSKSFVQLASTSILLCNSTDTPCSCFTHLPLTPCISFQKLAAYSNKTLPSLS